MQTRITARHFNLNDDLRNHIEARISKLHQVYDGITDASTILSVEKGHPEDHEAEIILNVYRQQLSARDMASSHEEAIDRCAQRLRRQLLRYKAKLRGRRK
ncbi:MAG: ribosome-associated translation inhibitor RaiA [Rhodothermales bacterium]|nr:ribosome-associated translation inhibitor RaiA [Rhodothermales bacterium]